MWPNYLEGVNLLPLILQLLADTWSHIRWLKRTVSAGALGARCGHLLLSNPWQCIDYFSVFVILLP